MNISPAFRQYISTVLERNKVSASKIINIQNLSGGSVNQVYKLQLQHKSLVLKVNSHRDFPNMFELEKQGLDCLNGKSDLIIPQVIDRGHFEENSFLILEYFSKGILGKKFWEEFGRNLARLHSSTEKLFGLNYDNYIGSLIQKNTKKSDWISFFIENRLAFQAQIAFEHKRIDSTTLKMLAMLYKRLHNFLPEEKPSLLHGDLWSGNFLVSKNGHAVLYDPAIYYGHREMDISMSLLFGGFHSTFYKAYHEYLPLESNWEERVDICNLYPLLVHVNLFGSSYTSRFKSVLKQFV
tara:strand:- start:280 stop:1164 length:885 start_codon:yes stop_codon:yes gene_type:complete